MRVLVTGGGGFLGLALVRRLIDMGAEVRTFQRGDYAQLEAWGVEQVRGDLYRDGELLEKALSGCDLVYHTAAKAGVWGDFEDFHRTNVGGTENLLRACLNQKVRRFVYTSSPSVTFDGRDQEGIDESAPYPKRFLAHYPATKAEAEKLVNGYNDADLATVSLRPHLIWGPGDNHLVPRVIERGRAGRLRLVGGDEKLVDSVFIDNCVEAHLCAAERLQPGAPIGGKNYFITNDEPVPMSRLLNGILQAGGLPEVTRRVSPTTAYAAGALLEGVYGLLGRKREPLMTRFVAAQLGTAHWFTIEAAKRDLGYQPKVTIDEGLSRLKQALSDGDWW